MITIRTIAICLFIAMLFSACAQKDEQTMQSQSSVLPQEGIEIVDPWARPGNTNGNTAVYMEIRNGSAAADTIRSLFSDVADLVELHETYETEDGMMGMRPAADPSIPAQGIRELRPRGLHIMVMGLRQDLRAGDSFELAIEFADGGNDTITVPVRMPGGS